MSGCGTKTSPNGHGGLTTGQPGEIPTGTGAETAQASNWTDFTSPSPVPQSTAATPSASTTGFSFQSVKNYFQTQISLFAQAISSRFATLADLAIVRRGIGSTFVQWGSRVDIPGTQRLYDGYAYGSYHGHAGNTEAECITGGDRGSDWVSPNWGDVIYLVMTGNAVYLPPPTDAPKLQPLKPVVCSVHGAPTNTFVMKGKSSCPANYVKLYGGFLMGGHYTHTGRISKPICVNTETFDSSGGYNSANPYAFIYGTHTYNGEGVGGADYPNLKWLKCAVCAAY